MRNVEGSTPLIIAASKGNLEAVRYFVQTLRARVAKVGRIVIEGEVIEEVTALWCACAGGGDGILEVVQFLVEAGADVNHKTKTNKGTIRCDTSIQLQDKARWKGHDE